MNNPYDQSGSGLGSMQKMPEQAGPQGGGFGQWQNAQSPQMFNRMLGRGGATPFQQRPQQPQQMAGVGGGRLFSPPNPSGGYPGGQPNQNGGFSNPNSGMFNQNNVQGPGKQMGGFGGGPYDPNAKPGEITGAQRPGGYGADFGQPNQPQVTRFQDRPNPIPQPYAPIDGPQMSEGNQQFPQGFGQPLPYRADAQYGRDPFRWQM